MAKPDPLARALVDTAFELHRRRLWLEVPIDAPFLIRVPDEAPPLVATIIGHNGSDYGVGLMRGDGAFAWTVRQLRDGHDRRSDYDQIGVLSVTMDPLGQIPTDLRRVLDAAGFHARRESLAPFLVAKPPQSSGRSPSRSEQRTLLAAIRGILLAHDAGELAPTPLDTRRQRIQQITVEGEWRSPTARAEIVAWPTSVLPAANLDDRLLDVAPSVRRLAERWVVGVLRGLPAGVVNSARLDMLFAMDEESRAPRVMEIVDADDIETIAEPLSGAMNGSSGRRTEGIPREVVFVATELERVLASELHALGIETSVDPAHPTFQSFVDECTEKLDQIAHAAVKEDARRPMPLPTTIEEWKDADHLLTGLLLSQIEGGRLIGSRARARYFGSDKLAGEVLQECQRLQPFVSFAEWYFADYRATKKSKTHLEGLLEDPLTTPLQRHLIEARIAARLSIYRIDAARPGESVDIEDIFDGTRFVVQDRAFSGCDVEGLFVPMRISKLGDWYVMSLAGPPLTAFQIGRAVELLERAGVELSAEGLRRGAHVTGRLWELMLERSANVPKLCNTDGDPLEWHTAVFRVADGRELDGALRARKDIRYDADDCTWVWSRPGPPVPGAGENTTLGTLEFIDDRLMVEVNSRARLDRMRAWLETVRGVAFESVTTRKWDEDVRPMDDALPSKRPRAVPEMEAKIAKLHEEMLRGWLDTPVPMLGGLSPRAACASAEGRRQVTLMVRTMPPMTYPGGSVQPPRELLLRELGIVEGN